MRKLAVLFVILTLLVTMVGCEEEAVGTTQLQIGMAYHAAHGTNAAAVAAAAVAGDKIVAAYLDELQYMDKTTSVGLPNSDERFGEAVLDPQRVLGSKVINNEPYSKNMAERGGSTVSVIDNFKAIESYAVGKTIAELEGIVAKTSEEVVDAVSGATMVDTKGYLETILLAVKDAQAGAAPAFTVNNVNNLKMNLAYHAAHGTNAVAIGVVVMEGNTIAGTYLDELQYMARETSIGFPNTDDRFGEWADPERVLASKRINNETYSKNMAERGGSTVSVIDNFNAIQKFANGKTVAELEGVVAKTSEEVVDAVSGATMVDTKGYLETFILAAKN